MVAWKKPFPAKGMILPSKGCVTRVAQFNNSAFLQIEIHGGVADAVEAPINAIAAIAAIAANIVSLISFI
jgi:hypothetical protein